jgi:hypothetical protein
MNGNARIAMAVFVVVAIAAASFDTRAAIVIGVLAVSGVAVLVVMVLVGAVGSLSRTSEPAARRDRSNEPGA